MIGRFLSPVKTTKNRIVSNLFTIPVILAMFFNLFSPVGTVLAEGSNDTVANGGKRANTEWRTNTTAGYYRRTFFRVYANSGEYILMGSSAMGVGSGDIVLYRESQISSSQVAPATLATITPTYTCSSYRSTHAGAGTLDTRAKELAGPASNTGGYTPCVYQATETGTYWVGMYGPDGVNGSADGQAGTVDAPVVDASQRSGVSMWDITVRSGSALTGTTKTGRVFVDYFAQFAGGNGETNRMYSTLYAVTPDGYVYKVDLNGIDPAGYILYGNRVGSYDPDGKTPLYHDVVYTDNSLTTPIGGVILAPASAKFFFQNPLTSDLPVSLLPTPVTPNIGNVNFVGTATNDTSYYSQGGVFTYTGNVGGISEIVIQGNTSTDFEPDNPLNRRILSESVVGSNSVTWDGKDNSGNYFPVRTNYPYKVIFHAGEYHFPLLDSENSVFGGPTLTLLNPIGGVCPFFANCHGAFYDDRVYKVSTGTVVPSNTYTVGTTLPGDANATNPPTVNHSDQNSGFDTSTTQRGYGGTSNSGFGNWKALDLWTYYPVDAVSKTLNVSATVNNDLSIVKNHSGNFSVGNNAGSFTITVKNVGTASIGNVNTSVTDTLPTGMTLFANPTGTNWTCNGIAGGTTFTCNRASGSSNRNLAAGASFEPITVRVNIASTIASSVTNTATLSNTNDGNATNNSSSDIVNISRAELTVSKTDSTAQKGLVNTPFNWEITATNSGELAAVFAANAVILSDPLSANATYGTPTVITANVTNPGAISCTVASNTLTCKANGGTVTMLEAGSSIKVTLPVTPTLVGSLANTVTVDPNNVVVESNEGNNTGSDSVTVFDPKLAVVKNSSTSVIIAVNQTVPYTFTLTNPGTQALSSISVSDAKCDASPTLTSGDTNSDAKLDTSETWVYSCVHTVSQAEFDAGTALSNTVTADSAETSPVTSTLDIPVIHLTVTKDAAPTSVLETGGSVTFTFTVKNQSSVALTISSLNDDKFAVLSGDADCQVGTSLAAGATCDFSYTTNLSGAAATSHVNTFAAQGTDGAGHTATASDNASVTFTDVKPAITVTKTASPISVPETGADVTFTFTVSNSGTVPVILTALSDDIYGTLAGDADCQVGTSLAAGANCSFEMTQHLSGTANTNHRDVFSASVKDNENNLSTATDDAVVAFTDVKPSVDVTKSATPTVVDETGGSVTFTFTVTNTGSVPATISALSDNIYGTLSGDSDCKVGTSLAVGASCSFDLTQTLSGAVSTSYVDVFTASIKDTENNVATDTDDATVAFNDVKPSITVTKEANPIHVPETGANVTFTFTVTNNGSVPAAITSLSDDVYGTLSGDADCQLGTSLAAGASCNFTQTEFVSGVVGSSHVDTFTANAADVDGNTTSANDDATVSFDDVLPAIEVSKTASPTEVDETGADVSFTFQVKNTGTVPVTLQSLSDNVYGSLSGDTDCAVGTTLAANASCDFTLVKFVSGVVGTPHTDTFSASAQDLEGNPASDTDEATVTFVDVKPAITVTKTAAPASVLETGEDVTFTFTVQNSGTVPATITELSDSIYGTLSGDDDCKVGTRLAAGSSCDFTLVKFVSGTVGSTHTNVFTAAVKDDENNPASDTDDATVAFTDVLPSLEVSKTADPTSLPETGGSVTYTFTVHNTGTVSGTITALSDDKFGALSGDADCQIGTELNADASCSFEVSKSLSGAALSSHTNVFSASIEDAEHNSASDTDDATVSFSDVLPALSVNKEVNPTELPETGGNATYTFTVTNTGSVSVTLDALTDDAFGSLVGDDDCKVGTVLPASGSCSFTLVKSLSGAAGTDHTNIFTASGTDADGNPASDTDEATVTFTDELPALQVSKDVSPDNVDETGGEVVYTFTVNNTGPVTTEITSLQDNVFGALSGDDDCKVGTQLAAGASCNFSLNKTLSGAVDAPHDNVFSAEIKDTEGNTDSASDDAEVTFNDVLPSVSVNKEVSPDAVDETGGDVTFTFTVTNDGTVPATITSLEDDVYGTLSGDADCKVGTILAPSTSCSFTLDETLSGRVGTPHTDLFTAEVVDHDGNTASNGDDATVTFNDVLPRITVQKAADPVSVPETGGSVTFTFTVENSGFVPVTIDSLSDSVFGILSGDDDCKVGTVLNSEASCSFTLVKSLSGVVGADHTNTFSVTASDVDGNSTSDDSEATVSFTDVLPSVSVTKEANPTEVPETGGDVTFTFSVTNNGTVPAAITSLDDSIFGTLSGDSDCHVGTLLAPSASCSFTQVETIAGAVGTPHSNTFTAKIEDTEGNEASDDATATVDFSDVLPSLSVEKNTSASSVDETGADVTFTFTVINTGSVPVTITALNDSVFGALSGDTDCQVGTELTAGSSCSFDQTEFVSGTVGVDHVNTFTATANDSEDNEASDNASATVSFIDVLPAISVDKSADQTSVDETGADVTFAFTVNNTGTVPVTIASLSDDVFGTLSGDADCQIGSVIAAGSSCSFSQTEFLSGSPSTAHHDTFTAEGTDTDGNPASATDDASVSFDDVLPAITVNKVADPTHLPESGGSVTFTYTVTNSGLVAVTLTDLSDDKFSVSGGADCKVGTSLAAGASCSFTYTTALSGDTGSTHVNTFSVVADDAEGNSASDTDDETVTFDDVLPVVEVTKEANPTLVVFTGADVTFTFTVKNTSTVPVKITSLEDDVFGTLSGDSDCEVDTELAAGASCSFTQVEHLSGIEGATHVNTFTASVSDTDGNSASDSDDATVTFDGTTILGIAKELVNKTLVETGNYDLTFRLFVKNYGSKDLSNLQVEDELSATFPSPTIFSVTSVTSSEFTVDPAYDGTTAHKTLLAGTDSLKAGENGTIEIVINVTPSGSGPFNNTALASAETPGGDKINDQSQDGPDPDGSSEEQDGNPNNNDDPTPVTFEGQLYKLPLGVKSVDATLKPNLTWTVVWINNTNKVPVAAEMHDAIPSKTTFVEDAALTGMGLPASAPAGSTITGVSCDSGTSTSTETTTCYYEAPSAAFPLGQIVWTGKLGPDFGVTDPALAVNAIRITYSVTANNTSYVKNVATLDADLNGDGNTNGAGETKVATVSATWGKQPVTDTPATGSATGPLMIPQTGFAPGIVTQLSVQPASGLYAVMDDMTLEIPALGINTAIVGVPEVDGKWDVSWLGNDAGWLHGTAFPTWAGNSVITGHVFDANGKPGLFADLTKLKYGDQIILHAFGQAYIYEVRETKLVTPNNLSAMTQHEDLPWLTLVTCRGYDEANNTYYFRYLVRAVQVKIK